MLILELLCVVEKQSQVKSLIFWSIMHLLHSSFEEFYIFDYVSNAHYYLMAVGNASSITWLWNNIFIIFSSSVSEQKIVQSQARCLQGQWACGSQRHRFHTRAVSFSAQGLCIKPHIVFHHWSIIIVTIALLLSVACIILETGNKCN